MLLVVPAFAIDLIRHRLGHGRSWLRDVLVVVLSSLAFVGLFFVTQWYFSQFLLSPRAHNWFFAADRHWGYTESLGPWRNQFWSVTDPKNHPPIVASTFAYALMGALISSALGLALGNWMAKVRR
jgi:hypothetical protein